MLAENLNMLQDDGDVVIEGSELHNALVNVGFTNFDTIPKAKMEYVNYENNIPATSMCTALGKSFNKLHCVQRFVFQENDLIKKQLNIILNSNILLDDHAAMVHEFIDDKKKSLIRNLVTWLPFIGSTAGLFAFAVIKKDISSAAVAGVVLSSSLCTRGRNILLTWKLKALAKLQSNLHNSIKHSLKILRRYCKKSIVSEMHKKNELIGSEKYVIILEIKKQLFELFESVSCLFYEQGNQILKILPSSLHAKCFLTKIEAESCKEQSEEDYDKLKSWYYTYILAQSETMFALANAYNGRAQDTYFEIPHFKLQKIVNKLYATLTDHYFHLCAKLQNYENCEIKPVERVFRSSPSSKWRDVYVHLDITSHRIQLAYKEIFNILELLDANSDDKDEDNLIELITAKMNEAYKQLENARCSAEFSSLLIVKTQKKAVTTPETENENLFSVSQDKRTVVMVNDMPVIEDEVFEEYIREAYLKPLMEGGNGIIDEYRLDKLLKKNFMSELKEALVDKQKSMMERELRALTRMYEKMKRDHCIEQPNEAIESASELDVKPPVSAPLAPSQLPTVSELDLKPLMPTSPPAPQQPPTVCEPDLEPSVPTPPSAPQQPSTVSESDLGPSVPTPPPAPQQPSTVSAFELGPSVPTPPPAPQQPSTVSESDLGPSVPTPPPAPQQPSTVSESDLGPSVPTPPPFLQQPPSIPNNRAIVEVEEPEENVETCKKTRGPVPLPRVKMWQSNDPMPYVQKFSISECTPNFKFPPFRAEEETFLGSGENSEEEEEENDKNINSSDSEEVEN